MIGEYFFSKELNKQLRLDLLDIIGEVSQTNVHDYSVDPINRSQLRAWQGIIPATESRLKLRKQAVELLKEIIRSDLNSEIRKTAAEKLVGFESEQVRYYTEQQEVFHQEELSQILEFATEYVSEGEDLQCIEVLSRLTDHVAAGELGVEKEITELEEVLEDDDRYQLLQKMSHGTTPKKREEREAEIRNFVEDIEERGIEPSDLPMWFQGFRIPPFLSSFGC